MEELSSSSSSSSSLISNNLLGIKFPVQNHSRIDDTEIIVTSYKDRHFVVISQLNKFGTLIEASIEEGSEGRKLYPIQVLFGKRDDPLLIIYARQIIQNISLTSEKPLLLSIALKSDLRDPTTFQKIINKIFEMATWM